MALECADAGSGLAVPDLDHGVLGARNDVLVIEADVENTSFVAVKTVHGDEDMAGNVPDNASVVGGSGDHDFGVVLEAEDGGVMVV